MAPRTVNTLPPETFAAYRDHGRPAVRIQEGMAAAPAQLKALAELGIDLAAITRELEDEGVAKFAASYALASGGDRGQGRRAGRPLMLRALRQSLAHLVDLHRDGRPASCSDGWRPSSPRTLKPLSDDLPPDDQVGRRADHLRHAGDRHRRPRRRPEAHRPAGGQVDRLLLAHDDDRAGGRPHRGQHHPARAWAWCCRRPIPTRPSPRPRPPRSADSSSTSCPGASSRRRRTTRCCRWSSGPRCSRIALTQVRGKPKEAMLGFCEGLTEVMFKFVGIVMRFAPIGIGAAMAVTVSHSGIQVLRNLGLLVAHALRRARRVRAGGAAAGGAASPGSRSGGSSGRSRTRRSSPSPPRRPTRPCRWPCSG